MSTPNRVMDVEEWKRLLREGDAPADVVLHKDVLDTEVMALDGKGRLVRFRITTGAVDRMKDTLNPAGWDLVNYKKNPVVLWAHQYGSGLSGPGLPIAKAVEIEGDTKGLRSVAKFATKEQYAFADTVYQLLLGGFLNATSVGFKPLKHVYNEQRGGVDFLEQELLEYSVVPIPANPEALVEGRSLDLDPLREWLDLQPGGRWRGWRADEPLLILEDDRPDEYVLEIIDDDETRSVPANVSTSTAPEGEPWSAPTLSDFTDKPWSKLSAGEIRHISGHFAWCRTGTTPETFGDLALPHHRPSDGKVVWSGVRAAMARANQVSGGNTEAIMAHLKAHARAFGKSAADLEIVHVDLDDVTAAFGHVVAEAIVSEYGRRRGNPDYSPSRIVPRGGRRI